MVYRFIRRNPDTAIKEETARATRRDGRTHWEGDPDTIDMLRNHLRLPRIGKFDENNEDHWAQLYGLLQGSRLWVVLEPFSS